MRLAVIPARGGSKRIPQKNIRAFAGKPMISYAISAARESGLFDHVIVSTEDQQIVDVARECGAEVPFLRPASLADDFTPTVPVVVDAIRQSEALGWSADLVCCIYPCVPFLRGDDLAESLQLYERSSSDYAFSVSEFPAAVQRAMMRDEEGRVSPLFSGDELTRTQDLKHAYHDAGQFYWGRRSAWLTNPRIHSNGVGFVLPRSRVVDIDTPDDWTLAELMYRAFHLSDEESGSC